MSGSDRWRRHLLGSLQGQLQLATYLAVFVGFTGASTAGLWIGQKNLVDSAEQDLQQSAKAIELCLLAPEDQRRHVEEGLLLHSSLRRQLWLERNDGELILPQSDHLPIPDAMITVAMDANPNRVVGQQHRLQTSTGDYLSELVTRYPSGSLLWASQEVSADQKALSDYLSVIILIWSGCMLTTLLAVTWLVQRIIKPLAQLTAATDTITADTLASSRLPLHQGPSEVMQLGQTYNALLERLADSWSQQRQFVSAVSHELRTPLTIIQGYVRRTIRRSNNLSEGQIKGLETAEEETIRMRRLLDDLLDLSRSDSGQLTFSQEAVSVVDQLEQVAELAQTTLKRPLHLELPDNPDQRTIEIQADAARLRQVLLDLIENADKYSPAQRPIQLTLEFTKVAAFISVKDQGIGIPESELKTVFQRFRRASNAPEKTGSGLGLSVVKLLVEGMGGTISVESRLGEGSTFIVQLNR